MIKYFCMKKNEIRKKFLSKRKHIPHFDRKYKENTITLYLMDYLNSIDGYVMSYYPIGSEVNIYHLNKKLALEKRLVLPYTKRKGEIIPVKVKDFFNLKKDEMGVLAPEHEKEMIINVKEIKIILVPGVAFDIKRYRLGYGKGCYDRFLKKNLEIFRIGITFDECITEHLPHDKWDVPMNMIISDKRIIK